jgi:hypothetical protein
MLVKFINESSGSHEKWLDKHIDWGRDEKIWII